MGGYKYTQGIIDTVIAMYPNYYAQDIARAINRSVNAVYNIAQKMGLKKSEAFMQMEYERQGKRLLMAGKNSRFNKGKIPHNKGKKMDPSTYERVKPTMFQKGIVPHNTKYNGHERISKDGYVEVRIRKGKYALKHRVIWEQVNGKVPKNHILIFKDGNKQNITLENLELITLRENMLRNSISRFPPELISTIKAVHKLKKAIYEKQN